MAENEELCVEPMTVCLRWKTERPYAGGRRRSPEFGLFHGVRHLEMELKENGCAVIRLHPHFSTGPSNHHPMSVVCHLDMKGKSISCNFTISFSDYDTVPIIVFARGITDEFIPEVDEWTVRCEFQETKTCRSLSLKVGDKRVHFSSEEIAASSPKTEDRGVQVSSEVPRDVESLSSDFSRLLKEEILPDAKLECSGRSFRAHRSVLGARSEVFRAMFQNGMLESQSGSVKIRDMDAGVLEIFLKFLYSGRPDELSEECVSDLYAAADKYDVPSLKTACAYWTSRNLTVENCIEFLKMAETHSDYDLKAAIVAFTVENPSVMKCEAWLELKKELPSLAMEVYETYFASIVP